MGHYPLKLGSRAVAESFIKNEIRDIAQALRPEDGIPARIEVTVRKLRPNNLHDNAVEVEVKVAWERPA